LFSAYSRKLPAYLLLTMFLMPCASAQEMSAIPAKLIIPDGAPINLRLAESVSSAHAQIGDLLDFVVVRDMNVDGFTVIPAGTMARGSVTGVKGRRVLGIGGKVSLKLDSLELVNGDKVALRGSKEVKGGSRTKLMAAAMIATALIFLPATPVFLLTRGHTSTVVKGTEITAQVEGATPVLAAGLRRSRAGSSELAEMMEYLPPRVFSGEGREGDMVNLVFVAQPDDLQDAFRRAGWVKTDKWNPIFVWHLLRHRTSDMQVPMARFYLFGRVQDYSYALPDPDAIVSRRHHLRIWKTDYKVDGMPIWAGAATHDVAIVIAKRGHLINHRIDPAVDAERDFVGTDLTNTSSVSGQQYLHSADPVFQAETASGEAYHSDSRILLLNLHQSPGTTVGVPGQSSTMVRATVLPIAAPEGSFQGSLMSPR
jgi:LssY C-terminus